MNDFEHCFQLRVTEIAHRADDVRELVLSRADGGELPPWEAGAHVSLRLTSGIERQYSLCGPVDDRRHWRVAVLRASNGRGGSEHVHTRLNVGDCLEARDPRNHFRLESAPSYVFIAGGIGITPILPMIEQARRQGIPWTLHYGGRSRASMAYREHLMSLGGAVHLVPQDEAGNLDLAEIGAQLTPGAQVYACGPEGLLNALVGLSSGWPDGTLHIERFAASIAEQPPRNRPFSAHLSKAGRTVHVKADESLLDAIAQAGISRESACREGTCGSCETRVLSGSIDHRDTVLSASERAQGEWIMICVSRAMGDEIELDI